MIGVSAWKLYVYLAVPYFYRQGPHLVAFSWTATTLQPGSSSQPRYLSHAFLPSPQLPESPLPHLPPRRPIHKPRLRTLCALRTPTPHNPQQHHHGHRTDNAQHQYPHHDQVRAPVLRRPGHTIRRPARIERIGRQNATQVTQATNQGTGGSNADLAVARLEDLRGPGHGYGDGGAEAEADEQKADVAGPGGRGEGGGEEAGDLEEAREREEEGAVLVEAVGEGGDEEDGY